MKPGRIIGIILSGAMMFFAVGAYFSNEPASKTQNGRIAIIFAFVIGFMTFINNAFPNNKNSKTLALKSTDCTCPSCGKPVDDSYKVCPYCQYKLHPLCPTCGKEVKDDFVVCPYCNTNLK